MWNTYIAVDSIDDAAAKVEAAGGKVAMAPFDIMDAGRMSFVMDPSGAAVALWQADKHVGATLVNEPGTLNWNELVTSDPAVFPFYSEVTGLTTESMDMGEGRRTPCSRRARRSWAARSRRRCRASQPLARVLRHRRRGRHRGQGHRAGRVGPRPAVRHPGRAYRDPQ